MIGGLLTAILGFMAIVVRMFGTTLSARFLAIDAKFDAKFDALTLVVTQGFEQVDKRFEQVDRRFEQVEKRLDRIEDRVDNLDRDVHVITRRLMDGPDQA